MIARSFAIDFDGCIAYHDYPFIYERIPNAMETMKKLKKAGHTLILLTMRSESQLDEAVAFCRLHDVEFDYINCNPEFETGSRKVYANYYLDDHGLGVPLIHDTVIHRKPFVDWVRVEQLLKERGLL